MCNDKPMNKRRAHVLVHRMRDIRMDQQRPYLRLRSSSRSGNRQRLSIRRYREPVTRFAMFDDPTILID